ncbi:MAG: 30S ribosomal protein S6 [Candidatus Dadabacteria bacterium]|nr:MAG: 30S ribosomal protein S6 [Candidatus Dadabacteria bacterium]
MIEEVKRLKAILEEKGAYDLQIENWGRREFAYEIKKEKMGFFINFTFQTEDTGLVDEVRRLLAISDTVLRSQSHRIDVKTRRVRRFLKKIADLEIGSDTGATDGESELGDLEENLA